MKCLYLAVLIYHSPAWAPQLVAYQRIITSTSAQYPLAAWLNYDTQFRTLEVSDPTLCWDTRHTDLWLHVLQTLPLLFAGHTHIVRLQITTLRIVFFVLTLYLHPPMSQDLPLQALQVDSS